LQSKAQCGWGTRIEYIDRELLNCECVEKEPNGNDEGRELMGIISGGGHSSKAEAWEIGGKDVVLAVRRGIRLRY
jgi:hypothetical protein